MILGIGLIGELARAFLKQGQGSPIVCSLKRDPAQGIRYMRIVRDSSPCLLRQVICAVEIPELIGINEGEIIEGWSKIRRKTDDLLICIASLGKMLQSLLERRKLHQRRDVIIILHERIKLVDRLLLAVGSDVDSLGSI